LVVGLERIARAIGVHTNARGVKLGAPEIERRNRTAGDAHAEPFRAAEVCIEDFNVTGAK